jgi:tetratricopeptide (TPR) repeat protein
MRGEIVPDRFLYFETNAGALNYGWQELRGVRFRNWKLIDSSQPELFDLDADPGEENDLAAAEPQRVQRFRAELLRVAEPIREERTASKTDRQLTPEQEAAFLALGYVAGAGGGSALEGARRPQDMIDAEGEIATAGKAIQAGDWPRVQFLCDYILGRDPANKWALTNTSLASISLGRPEEAVAPSKRLVELYPQNPNSYSTHGRALSEAGRADEAYELLLLARDTLEDSEAVGYFLLVAGFDAGKPVCDGMVAAALAEFPTSPRTHVMKSRCDLRGEGGVDAAIQTLTTAVQLGYKRLESLKHFDEFEDVVADPRFQALIELQNPDSRKVQVFPGTPAGS